MQSDRRSYLLLWVHIRWSYPLQQRVTALQARSGTQRLHNKYGGQNKVYKSFRIFVKDFIGVLNQDVGKNYYSTSEML